MDAILNHHDRLAVAREQAKAEAKVDAEKDRQRRAQQASAAAQQAAAAAHGSVNPSAVPESYAQHPRFAAANNNNNGAAPRNVVAGNYHYQNNGAGAAAGAVSGKAGGSKDMYNDNIDYPSNDSLIDLNNNSNNGILLDDDDDGDDGSGGGVKLEYGSDLAKTHSELCMKIMHEEEALMESHRLHIDATMRIVKQEMELMKRFDTMGHSVDQYITLLDDLLVQKADSISALRQRLRVLQGHLKEEEVLSATMGGGK